MAREMVKNSIRLGIYSNRALAGAAAAKGVAVTIQELLEEKNEINMVFAAAPSQNEFLAALIEEDVDWSRINAFHMDEYTGLDETSPATFAHYLKTHLFNHIHCKAVYCIKGNTGDAEAECMRYSGLLLKYPTDIVCMGIGENNHIAFNDPPVADFNDAAAVKTVLLDADCRRQQVNDGCFASLDEVPAHALTLTVPALLNCKYIFCIVPGGRKAKAVYNTFSSPVGEQYPSTALRLHGAVRMFVDEDSAAML
jgi:glucosamine-6-phosphate deaminase